MCNCKYGCCSVCSYDVCYGVCCSAPAPTCGCGELVMSGEICLNTTYYVYSTTCAYYYPFQFQYVLYVPVTGEPAETDALLKFIQWVYILPSGEDWILTTDKSDISNLSEYVCEGFAAKANNCFMWECDIYDTPPSMPFTSYDINSCNSNFPELQSDCQASCN